MEIINKILNTEGLKRRDFGKSPNVESGTTWGGIPKDYVLQLTPNGTDEWILDNFESIIPIVSIKEGDRYKYVLRYKNALSFYYFLENFEKTAEYYDLCKRNGEKTWIRRESVGCFSSEEFEYTDGLYTELPDARIYEGQKITANSAFGQVFSNLFSSFTWEDACTICRQYKNFIEEKFFKGNDKDNSHFSIPFAEFNFYLEEEIEDESQLIPYVEEWVPSKRYHIGSVVHNNEYGKYFKLENIDNDNNVIEHIQLPIELKSSIIPHYWTECTGGYYGEIFINPFGNYYEIDSNGNYYILVPTYAGEYNGSGETLFDRIEDGEFVHWKELNIEVKTDTEITVRGESRLNDFIRRKSSYDSNSVELPYIYSQDGHCELKYLVNVPINLRDGDRTDGLQIGSIITNVEVENYESAVTIYGCSAYPNSITPDSGVIVFEYIIDGLFSGNTVVENTGLKYSDKYLFTLGKMVDEENNDLELDETNNGEPFFIINYDGVVYDDSGNTFENALITFYPDTVVVDSGNTIHTYVDEKYLGITDINTPDEEELSSLTVERGFASLFEKMDYLSFSKSIEDMENFRNDYFSMKEE